MVVSNKVGIAVAFRIYLFIFFVLSLENHSPISPSADRLRSCQSDRGRYELLTAPCFSRKPKKKKKKRLAVCSSVRVAADCQREGRGKTFTRKKVPLLKKKKVEQQRE